MKLHLLNSLFMSTSLSLWPLAFGVSLAFSLVSDGLPIPCAFPLSVSLSVCQSVSLSVCLSVCQSVSQSVYQSVSLSVSQPVCQSVSQSVCQSVNQSVSQSVSNVLQFLYSCQLSDWCLQSAGCVWAMWAPSQMTGRIVGQKGFFWKFSSCSCGDLGRRCASAGPGV